jgi:HD superfamily phosphodiesterase
MDKKKIIKLTKKYMKENIPATRDKKPYLSHVLGARKYALKIAKKYGVNLFVIELSALLHDVGAYVGKGHAKESAKLAKKFLSQFDISSEIVSRILSCIKNHSSDTKPETLEQQIIQDGDGIIFLKEPFMYFAHSKVKLSPAKAKLANIKKVKAMDAKVRTEKGKKLAKGLMEKDLKLIDKIS